MSRTGKILTAGIFLVVLTGLSAMDVAFTGDAWILPSYQEPDDLIADDTSLPPLRRKPGPDVVATAERLNFAVVAADEDTLTKRVLPAGFPLSTRALLLRNDRAAAIAWMDSPQVREIFTNIKRQLRSSFSPDLRDLIDERQAERGKPPRDVLSFLDPAIHPDRILLVRVRQRLYEFHVVKDAEGAIDSLIDELTE